MSKDSVIIPTNTNRYNEYREWDRGLILLDDIHVFTCARVMYANWVTKGDIMSPGVLSYRMEYFEHLPSNVGGLQEFKAFEDVELRQCITRGVCDNPIIIEAYAIQHFLKSVNDSNPDRIHHVNDVAQRMVNQLSKGVIQEMTTSVSFSNTITTPLEINSAVIEYIAKVSDSEGNVTTLQDVITPDFNRLRPFYLVLDDINTKTQPTLD